MSTLPLKGNDRSPMDPRYTVDEMEKKNQNEWNKMLSQARLAMELDGKTALGLALGKALRYFWDQHLAERHARNDLKEKRNAEIESGNISDPEAFRAANGNPSLLTLDIPTESASTPEASTPVTGETWERYSVMNGVPGTKNYKEAAREQVMPLPQLNTGALTTEELMNALADPNAGRRPYYFGGGF